MTRFVLSRLTDDGVETATVTVEPMLQPSRLRITFSARMRVDRPGESTVIEGPLSKMIQAAKDVVTAFKEDGWETVRMEGQESTGRGSRGGGRPDRERRGKA